MSVSAPALLESSQNPGPPTCDASTSPISHGDTRQHDGVPARLTGRHFLGQRESDGDCKVCSLPRRKRPEEDETEAKRRRTAEREESERGGEEDVERSDPGQKAEEEQEEEEQKKKSEFSRRRTAFYCKTCAGEPSLCAVPCFELYHTQLIYRTAAELETQGGPPLSITFEQLISSLSDRFHTVPLRVWASTIPDAK